MGLEDDFFIMIFFITTWLTSNRNLRQIEINLKTKQKQDKKKRIYF